MSVGHGHEHTGSLIHLHTSAHLPQIPRNHSDPTHLLLVLSEMQEQAELREVSESRQHGREWTIGIGIEHVSRKGAELAPIRAIANDEPSMAGHMEALTHFRCMCIYYLLDDGAHKTNLVVISGEIALRLYSRSWPPISSMELRRCGNQF